MSKYSSLPDIDSAPDVYETPDVPAEFSHEKDSDSDSEINRSNSPNSNRRTAGTASQSNSNTADGDEIINNSRLDTSEARRRFGEASLVRKEETKSTSKRLPSRRLPNTDVYSSTGTGGIRREAGGSEEKETTIERLRRLRSEIEELEEDVKKEALIKETQMTELDSSTTIEVGTEGKGKKREISPAVILQQIQMLRGDLGIVESIGGAILEGNGEKEDLDGMSQRIKVSSSLLSKLGINSVGEAVGSNQAESIASGSGSVQKVNLIEGDLEKRLSEIERVVGANESSIDETNPLPTPLLQTMTRLDHLLTLLTQPRHLDSISRRVKMLVTDLERLHESRRKLGDTRPINIALSGGMTVNIAGTGGMNESSNGMNGLDGGVVGTKFDIPPDSLQKIDSLFSLLPRLDPLLPLTPRLLSRLRSLSTLHSSANQFGETLLLLKSEIERLGEGEKGLKEVLEGLEESLKENEAKVKGNLNVLDLRLKGLVERLDKLE